MSALVDATRDDRRRVAAGVVHLLLSLGDPRETDMPQIGHQGRQLRLARPFKRLRSGVIATSKTIPMAAKDLAMRTSGTAHVYVRGEGGQWSGR